jgi:uncharacterized repeat protein (TIGR01451 family)
MRAGRRFLILLAVITSAAAMFTAGSAPVSAQGQRLQSTVHEDAGQATASAVQPTVSSAVQFGESKAAADLASSKAPTEPLSFKELENEVLHLPTGDGSAHGVDPALQKSGGSGIPPTSRNFDGINIGGSSSDGVFVGAPPDTNGDVGPNHYVQMVNTTYAVYSKDGNLLAGPTPINALWESAPNAEEFNCTTGSRGDPIVQYDPMADRWILTQFNFPGVAIIAPPYDECIAVSQTPDPTGEYYLYDFHYSNTLFNDYPHFGVWPDAYYVSYNQFDTTTGAENATFKSAGACAFERDKMLAGDPAARQVCFDESAFDPKDANGNYIYGGQLPTDLDGVGFGSSFTGEPPAGSPNYYMQFLDSTTAGQDKLLEFKFHVDWTDPANSWFGSGPGVTELGKPIEISVADFDSNMCNFERNCIPQKISDEDCVIPRPFPELPEVPEENEDTVTCLDAISDRIMYRLAYRNYGDHESIVANHTVDVGDFADHAGIRWYEIRNPGGTPTVRQRSTWAPNAEHRWMGSIAMDSAGAVALGYSLSSRSRDPAIAYAARRPNDPLGQLSLGEGLMFQGTGSQTGTDSRWGDYSSLNVDPDGCTFWFTTEYYPGDGSFNWATRIGAFTLPTCGDPQLSKNASTETLRVRDTLTYTIAVTTGMSPVTGATVTDDLPSGVTLISAKPTSGSCTGTSTVVCNLGNLGAGKLAKIIIRVHVDEAGTLTNTATLTTTSEDSDTSNNTRTVKTEVYNPCEVPGFTRLTDPQGDELDENLAHDALSLSIAEPNTDGPAQLWFTLKMANLEDLPPDTTWPVTFDYGQNDADPPATQRWYVAMKTNASGQVSFKYGTTDSQSRPVTELGDLDPESNYDPDGTITLVISNSKLDPATGDPPGAGDTLGGILVRIRQEAGPAGAITPDNMPDSAAPDGDYRLSGNSYCDPAADLLLGKHDSADPARVNKTLSYYLNVNNLGPDTATGVNLVDNLPASAKYKSVSTPQGTCTFKSSKNRVTCDLGDSIGGGAVRVTIKVTPTKTGRIVNSASASSVSPADPDLSNNSARSTTLIVR